MDDDQIKTLISESVWKTLFPTLPAKMTYKLEKALISHRQNVEAIRLYPQEFEKVNVNSTTESGENPELYTKLTERQSTGKNEFEFMFLGSKHSESLDHFKKPREEWGSWGEIVITLDQARELVHFILTALSCIDVFKELDRRGQNRRK